jgi:hypothetical protein
MTGPLRPKTVIFGVNVAYTHPKGTGTGNGKGTVQESNRGVIASSSATEGLKRLETALNEFDSAAEREGLHLLRGVSVGGEAVKGRP